MCGFYPSSGATESNPDLQRYRGLRSPWNDWAHVVRRGRYWAEVLARSALEEMA